MPFQTNRQNSSKTTNDLRSSFQVSSNFLDDVGRHLDECNASSSPDLDELSFRLSSLRGDLENRKAKEVQNTSANASSSSVSRPNGSGILVKIRGLFSRKQKEVDFRDIRRIQEACYELLTESTTTATRRAPYKSLYDLASSHDLPEDTVQFSRDTEPLEPHDRVTIAYDVTIREGSYLDSSKYGTSGPMLITLAQKAINFIVAAQNPHSRLKKYSEQLKEVTHDVHYVILQIGFTMRDSPDDAELQMQYMQKIESIIEGLWETLQSPQRLAASTVAATADGYHRLLLSKGRSLETLRSSRSIEQKTEDILETSDEIVLSVDSEKHTYKKKDLTWPYLMDSVIPSLNVPILEVTDVDIAPSNQGGFAVVYCGRTSDGKRVALKFPWGPNEEETVLCLRFIREVYVWKKAGDNPFIQKLIGICFLRDGRPAMVSSWCNDGNLHKYLENAKLDRKGRLELALQTCLGLKYLHECNIVHADLKTDNILIENGKAKLHDFGISRIVDDATGLSTRVHGHCRYQAHEVLEAQKDNLHSCVTAKSDIFSFGRVLYECLTGCVPFSNVKSDSQVTKDVKNLKRPTDPEYEMTMDGESKEECIRLMKDCWHESPVPRPSAAQLVDRLQEIIYRIKV